MEAQTQRITRCYTVLLVDDDPLRRMTFAAHLGDVGYRVQTAATASSGLEMATLEQPDVIVSDELVGFELTRQLRGIRGLEGVPIIVIGGAGNTDDDDAHARQVRTVTLLARTNDFRSELATIERYLARPRRATASSQLALLAGQAHAAEQRFQTLFMNAREAVSIIDLDGQILEASPSWEAVLGYTPDELVGRHIRAFAVEGNATETERKFQDAVQTGRQTAPVPLRHQDGRIVYCEFSATVIEHAGRPAVISFGHDVTARVEAEHRLAAEEARYRSLIENIPHAVWSTGPDGELTYVAPNIERLTGWTPAEFVEQQHDTDMIHRDDQARVATARQAYATGAAPGFDVEYRRQRRDGSWMWVHDRAFARHRGPDGDHVDGVFSDITARKQLEDEMRQAQKMEAIGLLSGGIAHDFNNILSVILANSEFLLDALTEGDPRRSDANEIFKAGQRAAGLTRQLLAFSRRQVLEPTTVNLNAIITALTKMLRRLLSEDVDLVVKPGTDLGTNRVDVGQIEQVIVNLAVNARDAMPNGGALTIATANVELDEIAAAQVGCQAGRYVELSITDTGCGMDAATRARIFEPFFTTKPVGRGTGLGLSTCYGIVQQSGGAIAVYSELGSGSVFRVYLPCVDAAAATGRPSPRGSVQHGTETVLVVEDDPGVCACVCRVLDDAGYRVLAAHDRESALDQARTSTGPIALIVTDMVLPGVNGPEIVEALQSVVPAARVLFMSGYSDHPILQNGVDGLRFLRKPFTRDALAGKVRDVLDA